MKTGVCLSIITLLMAAVASVGIVSSNNAVSENAFDRVKIKNQVAILVVTAKEGSIRTYALVYVITSTTGIETGVCVEYGRFDEGTNTGLQYFDICGPGQIKVNNGLTSASFSGTATGTEFFTGQQIQVNVNAQLSGTGAPELSIWNFHDNNPYATTTFHEEGRIRLATGSINLGGDVSFSTNDATGSIGDLKFGEVEVHKVVG